MPTSPAAPAQQTDTVAFTPSARADRLSERVLETLSLSLPLAVVGADRAVQWHNPPFAALVHAAARPSVTDSSVTDSGLAGSDAAVGEELFAAVGCLEPDECPLAASLRRGMPHTHRLELPGGSVWDLTVQPLEGAPTAERASGRPQQFLCRFRDATGEQRTREKLLAIHRAGVELNHLTPEELTRMSAAERTDLLKANILQYTRQILEFTNCEIRVLDPASGRLDVLLSEGMADFDADRPLYAKPTGNGVSGVVAATAQPVMLGDVSLDPNYLPGMEGARSSLTVPIVYRGDVVGTFNVESPEPYHFSNRDADFLEVFAREIAGALHTLDLLHAEQRHGGRTSLQEVLHRVSLPADEILSDTSRIRSAVQDGNVARAARRVDELVRRISGNAREIKESVQEVRRQFDAGPDGGEHAEKLRGRRVLLVDEDPQVRRLAHQLLGRVGCRIDTAKDGGEAAMLLGLSDYDVVLADIRLPDLNGYQFYMRSRDLAPETPVVLMTGFGYDPTHSLVKARQAGCRVMLYKPFHLDRLCEAVAEAMDPAVTRKAQKPVREQIL